MTYVLLNLIALLQLSIWDLRMKENGGCVQRIMGSVGNMLYAVSVSSSGYIAAGGEDRTVTVYDPRRYDEMHFRVYVHFPEVVLFRLISREA